MVALKKIVSTFYVWWNIQKNVQEIGTSLLHVYKKLEHHFAMIFKSYDSGWGIDKMENHTINKPTRILAFDTLNQSDIIRPW